MHVWVVASLVNLVVTGVSQQYQQYPPVPYTDDACLATCGHCDYKEHVGWERWHCCVWDYGCWANPLEPDYQVSLCDREVVRCIVTVSGPGPGYTYGYYCCEGAVNCDEIDGAPCCEPYHTHPCPW